MSREVMERESCGQAGHLELDHVIISESRPNNYKIRDDLHSLSRALFRTPPLDRRSELLTLVPSNEALVRGA